MIALEPEGWVMGVGKRGGIWMKAAGVPSPRAEEEKMRAMAIGSRPIMRRPAREVAVGVAPPTGRVRRPFA